MTAARNHVRIDASRALELLLALRDIADETAAIDPDAGDGDPGTAGVVSQTLGALLDRTITILAALQHCDDTEDVVEPNLDAVEPDAWLGSAAALSPPPRIGDYCFAGTLELRRVQRELVAAEPGEELVVAADTAHRKLRRAIRAVLEAARVTGVHDVLGGEHRGHHHVSDLASAIAVRRLYAAFRRALRRPTDSSAEAVLTAVRYAAGALATLVAAPDYADVRASDRAVLRSLRERALHWARHDRSVPAGLQLLDDVWTCGDLLRGINRRQELRHRDAAVISACVGGPRDDLPTWLAEVETLHGLDDELDHAVAEIRAAFAEGRQAERLVEAAVARLRQVR
jgi:hypothetical protein